MVQPTGCHFQTDTTTVTTAGTAVQLSSADEHVRRITFRGAAGNTGNIGIGKSDVAMSSASWILKPSESISLNFDPNTVLLSDFYVDADNDGDKLEWIIGAELFFNQGGIAHSSTTGIGANDHHTKYLDSEAVSAINAATISPAGLNLPAAAIDAITELAAALKSGADATVITGTAGTNGDLSQWNADGDLVDGPTPPSGAIVGVSDTQTLTGKTIDADGAGNVITNIGASEIKVDIISGQSALAVSPAAGDELLFNDGGVLKKITADDFMFGDATTPTTQAHGDSATTGSAIEAARIDHKHAMPAAASSVAKIMAYQTLGAEFF